MSYSSSFQDPSPKPKLETPTRWYVITRNRSEWEHNYGVAATSRLLKSIGLFCKSDLSKRRYSAKESYDFKEPTNGSHKIPPFALALTSTSFASPATHCNTLQHILWVFAILYQSYGVAATSRLFKIIGLFCKRDLSKRRYSAKETYNFKEPTSRSQPSP